MQQIHLTLSQWAVENVIVLNVRLNQRTMIQMMLDTGAKYTIITPEVARRLGMEALPTRRIPVTTATQLEMARLFVVDQMDVHGVILSSVETAVLALPSALGVDGLLGMSFLKRCRLVLDFPNRLFELSAEE